MKSLRRSLNSDKNSSSSTFSGPTATLPSTSAAPGGKVLPPQKVIRALHSHKSDYPQILSYQKGDFFYVSGELDGDAGQPAGWYQALNPLTGSRGRVPKDQFEEFVKGGRATSGTLSSSGQADPRPTSPASSQPNGYQGAYSPSIATSSIGSRAGSQSAGLVQSGAAQQQAGTRRSGGFEGKKPNPLYAIVQYDFEAERPDELDAKAGEPIIVIAQSNHEWFVAKPIGRLGGPGLIPVSFVEIRDPVTSRPVENVQELLAGGSIPPVEEWKKATAEYKAASIPLGRFDFAPTASNAATAGGVGGSGAGGEVSGAGPSDRGSMQRPVHAQAQPQMIAGGSYGQPPSREERVLDSRQQGSDTILSDGEIVSAHVVSFHYEANAFWFRINATFLPDSRSSRKSATSLVLYRLYEDFYNFQITLLDLFPREAGRSGGGAERILPFMPGPLDNVDIEITSARREDLDTYLHELVALRNVNAGYILQHEHVLGFFSPGPGDQSSRISRDEALATIDDDLGVGGVEERPQDVRLRDGVADSSDRRYSATARRDSQVRDREQEFFGRNSGRVASLGNGGGGGGRGTPSTQASSRGDSPLPPGAAVGGGGGTVGSSSSHNADPSRPTSRSSGVATAAMARADPMFSPGLSTSGTTASWGSTAAADPSAQQPPPGGTRGSSRASGAGGVAAALPMAIATGPTGGSNTPPFIKIKVLDRTTDDMIAIRVPPRVTYAQLLDKIRDRLGNAVKVLQFRRQGGGYGDLLDDEGLYEWLRVEEKLVLYAE